jgi:hypothetical protein
MNQSRSPSRGMTGEEYLRQCTLRNPAFRKEQKEFSNRRKPETPLFAEPMAAVRKLGRGHGIEALMEEEQRKQGLLREVIELSQMGDYQPGRRCSGGGFKPGRAESAAGVSLPPHLAPRWLGSFVSAFHCDRR